MICIPKYRDIFLETRTRTGLAGRYKLTKGKGSIITGETPWFDNIITNNGLNDIADAALTGRVAYCHVGTGTTTETATDTALETFVASTNSTTSTSSGAQASPPYYAYYIKTFRFNPGFAGSPGNVNIAEVGVSDQATTGDLFSRARVKDGASPLGETTITVLGDEWLDVTYEVRLYPDHVLANGSPDDGTGTITIAGAGSPDLFTYAIRPAYITSTSVWVAQSAIAQYVVALTYWATTYNSSSTLGAVTSIPTNPSGSAVNSTDSSVSYETYSADTYERDATLTIGLNDGNASGGVGAIQFNTGFGGYQMSFSPAVPKDATKVWNFVVNLAWTRAVI